jgi:hypothetical protein
MLGTEQMNVKLLLFQQNSDFKEQNKNFHCLSILASAQRHTKKVQHCAYWTFHTLLTDGLDWSFS